MITWGVSANHHDASLSVIADDEILFAAHAERYSRIKNDPHLNPGLLAAALSYGEPDRVVWYEKPWLSWTRRAFAGQWDTLSRKDAARCLRTFGITAPVKTVGHHESHAAGGYFTSGSNNAAIMVVDAIGEWATTSLWHGKGNTLRKVWSQSYPHSLGLLYSAMTQRIGFKPNEEEFIAMGAAAFGVPFYRSEIEADFFDYQTAPGFRLRNNVHKGIRHWRPDITSLVDIAASVQAITEDYLVDLVRYARREMPEADTLVFSGGVALNCVANAKIVADKQFQNFWVMPNPGDAGSSLGAVAAYEQRHLKWRGPYLGTDIARDFDVYDAVDALQAGEIIGVAQGRAEFGPRSLGNRSLLADPRPDTMKDRVNTIKHREPFRPFAPVILAERAADHFEMPVSEIPYMQMTVPVKNPAAFPAISHVDGTARVQTVTRQQNRHLYDLLSAFYVRTGCPMLLNTSLNIKGEPLVDTLADADRFSARHDVKVF
jgi:carbamoyltransferase